MNQAQFWGGAAVPYSVDRSLRFNDGDEAYLNFTPSSAGNQKTWTFSFWIKRGITSHDSNYLFMPEYGGDGQNECQFGFDSSDQLRIMDSGGLRGWVQTTQRFRDVSAWYHIVLALDTTQATESNRVKLYVNGQQVTDFEDPPSPYPRYPDQNDNWGWNAAARHDLGRYAFHGSNYFDGYMAEVNFVDGEAKAASDFGETDSTTGAWIPKKYTGDYGSQGWYLNFSDNSNTTAATLGADSSGNDNDWTPNAFSVTAGTGNDSMEDTPTNNWCTLNPLNRGVDSITVEEGNLRYSTDGTDHLCVASMALPSSGQWYWEYRKDSNGTNTMVGILGNPESSDRSNWLGSQSTGYSVYAQNGQKYNSGSGSTYMATPGTNSTITVAYDADNRRMYVGADGNWGDGSGNTDETFANAAIAHTLASGPTYFPAISVSSGNAYVNFGQRPFDHTPPSGYQALNSENLPEPTVKNGTKYMQTVLYEGNQTARNITVADNQDDAWQPDWVWIKGRPTTSTPSIYDSIRGATKYLRPDDTDAETTDDDTLTAFRSDGFSLGDDVKVNTTGDNYVSWNWKAGGSSSTNENGQIDSEVSANTTAGFSVVTYTGPGATRTVGHGLGVAPKVIIIKGRKNVDHWFMYNANLDTPNENYLYLNLGNDETSGANPWNSTAPTDNVFTIVDDGGVGSDFNGNTYVAYCFAEIEGYSKFGKYEGNGLQPDGTYVYTGFKPAWLMIKKFSAGDAWFILDNKRDTYNFRDTFLKAENPGGEGNYNITGGIDFLSNGFKVRDNDGGVNDSGADYVYMAFAEYPFKYATAC